MFKSVGRLALSLLISTNSIVSLQLFSMGVEEKSENCSQISSSALTDQYSSSDSVEETLPSTTVDSSYHLKELHYKEMSQRHRHQEDKQPATESAFLFQKIELTEPESKSIWQCMPKDLQDLANDLADDKYRSTLPNLIVLYGPNGTGKSKMSAVIAKKASRSLAFINSGFVGTMYKNSEKFNLGEAIASVINTHNPSVVVIDEADLLTSTRQHDEQNDNALDKTIGELIDLCEKNKNIFFIFTTNNAASFGNKLNDLIGDCFYETVLPSAIARKTILDSYIKSFIDIDRDDSLNLDEIAGTAIAKDSDGRAKRCITDGFSVRRLRRLVQSACNKAKHRPGITVLKQEDFEEAYQLMQKRLDAYYSATRMARFKNAHSTSKCII